MRAYYDFASLFMAPGLVLASLRALALSARWWPAPVELLEPLREADWRIMLMAFDGRHRDDWARTYDAGASDLCKDTVDSLGGRWQFVRVWERDGPTRARRAWIEAYNRTAALLAVQQ